MKKYSCFIIILLAVMAGCKKADYMLYNDSARIQMSDTMPFTYTFVYTEPGRTRDTVYIKLNTIGGITDNDRTITLEQIPEYDITYKRDPVTNKVIDSTITEKP